MKPRLKKFRKNNIDLTKLVAAVRALAAENPERVYASCSVAGCVYKPTKQQDGGTYGCIVGEALRRIGVSSTGLDSVDGEQGIYSRLFQIGIRDDVQIDWLTKVQGLQDSGTSWSEAVLKADDCLPLTQSN